MNSSKLSDSDNNDDTSKINNMLPLVDIGINLTHRTFGKNWQEVVQRAIDAGVTRMILTGTSIEKSRQSIQLAKTWYNNNNNNKNNDEANLGVEGVEKKKKKEKNLVCTVGIHPHDAKTFEKDKTINEMRTLIQKNKSFVVAVGECGLDFDRNFSSKDDQTYAFQQQVKLAIELDNMPLFVHERNAHEDLVRILDEIQADISPRPLPPIVVHCFTGTLDEAQAYLHRGYYIGFTGFICKMDRGEYLRKQVLPNIPLERIMIETDAPFMSFVKTKGQRNSEPAHVVGVAKQLSETLHIPLEQGCSVTTKTAIQFFRLDESSS